MSELRELFALDAHANDVRHKTFIYIRPLRPNELERIPKVSSLLYRMTDGSGLKHLRQAEADFHRSIEHWEAATRSDQIHALGRLVQRDFKLWLSGFRALDDHTSAWLAKAYGKESDIFRQFKESLSEEYDSNFAYRLCATLRNASEHVSQVINDAASTLQVEEDGTSRHVVKLQFDGPRLCSDFPKLKASVRAELATLPRPLQVEAVVGAATLSCERVHCRLLLILWDELAQAIVFCDELKREAEEAGGQYALFVGRDSFPPDGGPLAFQYSPQNLADLVGENRKQADNILSLPLVLEAEDLT